MDKLTPQIEAAILRLIGNTLEKCPLGHDLPAFLNDEAARREAANNYGPTPYEPKREGLGSAAPFRVEVGIAYARRDGTGPVKIVADGRGVWPMQGDDGQLYTRAGHFRHPANKHPRDLVALWQAEAPQPVVSPDLLLRGIEPQADDLVHRLRFAKYNFEQEGDLAAAVSMKEAADRIDALKAQNKELDGQNFLLSVDVSTLKARVAKFEAEITRVRPKADCYDLVCATLGIEKNIIGHVEGINARVARLEDALSKSIRLSAAERQSKHTRVKWAEGLIRQLPITHEGAQSWLLNYGTGEHAADARAKRGLSWDHDTQSAALAGETNG